MQVSIRSLRRTRDWLPRRAGGFLNQGNLPKSTLSTLSMQQIKVFRKHRKPKVLVSMNTEAD